MFNPDLSVLLKNHVSRYSLVTANAKRRRAIADEAHFNGDHLTEKPVSIALGEMLAGKYEIIEPEEIRDL